MGEVAVEAWAPCLLCEDLVTKENVIEHLMENHDKVYMATVLALLMFEESDDGKGADE